MNGAVPPRPDEPRAVHAASCEQPGGQTHAFRLMNQTSVLGRYLWVFRRIVGQMQHDLFHVYTVDQHILMVLRNVRRFFIPEHAHEYPFCSQLAAQWDKPWILYIAALFHDVAKGRGGDHSDLGAREVRRFCRDHAIAARGRLADRVPREGAPDDVAHRAEGRPVRPRGDRRLREAARQRTPPDGAVPADGGRHPRHEPEGLERLEGQAARGPVPPRRCARSAARGPNADAEIEARKQEARHMLNLLHDAARTPKRRCGRRSRSATSRATTPPTSPGTRARCGAMSTRQVPVVRARLSPVGEGLQVLVYAPDRPDLFARICGYFDSAGFNILDAKIHTTRTGYALDTFQVVSPMMEEHYRDLISLVETQAAHALAAAGPLPEPSRGRISRRVKSFPVTPRVTLRPDERAQRWLLSVSTSDRSGLLYAIARVLAKHRINLQLAKITTLGERVEDTFLVDGAGAAAQPQADRDRNRTARCAGAAG